MSADVKFTWLSSVDAVLYQYRLGSPTVHQAVASGHELRQYDATQRSAAYLRALCFVGDTSSVRTGHEPSQPT
jgi:hypothetical protein